MKIFTAFALAAALAAPALAQDAPKAMDHSGHMMEGAMGDYMTAMDKMSATMGEMTPTGDADADFLMMMIPHHQSAIDMAKAELAAGKDDETKALAQKIIEAQEGEIAMMKEMLARLGHPMK